MRKIEYANIQPITIKKLSDICKRLKDVKVDGIDEFSKEVGIPRYYIETLRHILGYAKFYKRMTLEKREEIVAEYKEGGVSMNALARKHGVDYNCVRSLLVARDVTITTNRNWSKRQDMYLIDSIRKGKKCRQIAEDMGKTYRSVEGKARRMRLI